MYQSGFVIFSSSEDNLRDFDFCFIATSNLFDWRRIQIDMFDLIEIDLIETCLTYYKYLYYYKYENMYC